MRVLFLLMLHICFIALRVRFYCQKWKFFLHCILQQSFQFGSNNLEKGCDGHQYYPKYRCGESRKSMSFYGRQYYPDLEMVTLLQRLFLSWVIIGVIQRLRGIWFFRGTIMAMIIFRFKLIQLMWVVSFLGVHPCLGKLIGAFQHIFPALQFHSYSAPYIFKEENSLANYACNLRSSSIFHNLQHLSAYIRGQCLLDMSITPFLRRVSTNVSVFFCFFYLLYLIFLYFRVRFMYCLLYFVLVD